MTLNQLFHFLFDIISGNPETRFEKPEISFNDKNHTDQEDSQNVHRNTNRMESFKMPLHYPLYKKDDYEKMEEWRLDNLLQQYGLVFQATLEEKRDFAMGAFLWPDQL